jgi:hypothetical protein
MRSKLSGLLNGEVNIIRAIFYVGFTFIFGYAALFKVFEWPPMMEGMESFGFDRTWTLIIGYAELLGFIGLLAGLRYPLLLRLSILWLIPFSIGAFTAHMARAEYQHFHNALFCCIAAVVLILTDQRVKIVYKK